MGRRATKKWLRRAESAVAEGRLNDAEKLYRELMDSFQLTMPSLLDYAGGVMGLVRVLYLSGRDLEAHTVAESAYTTLADDAMELEYAAA